MRTTVTFNEVVLVKETKSSLQYFGDKTTPRFSFFIGPTNISDVLTEEEKDQIIIDFVEEEQESEIEIEAEVSGIWNRGFKGSLEEPPEPSGFEDVSAVWRGIDLYDSLSSSNQNYVDEGLYEHGFGHDPDDWGREDE